MDSEETKAAVAAAAGADVPSDREKAIVQAWERLATVRQWKKEQSKQTKEKIDGGAARLRESIEQGTHAGDTAAMVAKLRTVEGAWHSLEEAKAERVEVMKACKESIAAGEKKLRETIELSAQLSMFNDPKA